MSDPISLDIVTSAPSVPIILTPQNNLSISDATPNIIGVADANNQIIINIDEDQFTVLSDNNGAWNLILPSSFALSDGRHTISAIARDLAGNQSAAVSISIDKVSVPTPVSGVTPSPVAETTPGVTSPAPTPGGGIISLPSTALITETTGATELAGIPVPQVMASEAKPTVTGDILSFTGSSLPNFDVVVYIHSDQALVYRTRTDANGNWRVDHSQAVSELTPGQHTIYAVALDTNAKVKSRPSAVSSFTVERSFWVMVFNLLNWKTTAVTLIFLMLTIYWLYWVRNSKSKKKARI
jgi:hypothetical protein